jgi:hypothetical protein
MFLVHNERTKLSASWLNALATAVVAAGLFAPAAALLYGLSDLKIGALFMVGVALACLALGAVLHLGGRMLLGRLREWAKATSSSWRSTCCCRPCLSSWRRRSRSGSPIGWNGASSAIIRPSNDLLSPPARPVRRAGCAGLPADPDKVRARLHKILAEARAAETIPWGPGRASLYRTIFPQMTQFLPEEEGAQLRFEFAAELERLKAA